MKQTATLAEQDRSQQTGKTEVSQAQPTVGRFAEIPQGQWTPEQQEAYRSFIDAEGLEPGAALPSAPLKIWMSNPKLSKAVASLIWHLRDRKSTRLNSSHQIISYAVFCLKKKTKTHTY